MSKHNKDDIQLNNNNIKATTGNDEQNESSNIASSDVDNYSITNNNDDIHNNINSAKDGTQPDSARNALQLPLPTINRGYIRKATLNNNNNNNNSSITSSSHVKAVSPWKKKLAKFIDSTPVLIIMSVFTVFVLFITDIQAAFLRKEVDFALNVILSILLGLFAIEFVLACIAKPEYPLSFFFWLDLIATVSMIQDIDWIMFPIMGYGPHDATITHKSKTNKGATAAAKALDKVNSATRATRVLRIIRIVRLIRMVRLYKNVVLARQKKEKEKAEEMKNMMKNERELSDVSSTTENSSLRRTSSSSNQLKERLESNSEEANSASGNQTQTQINTGVVGVGVVGVNVQDEQQQQEQSPMNNGVDDNNNKVITTSGFKLKRREREDMLNNTPSTPSPQNAVDVNEYNIQTEGTHKRLIPKRKPSQSRKDLNNYHFDSNHFQDEDDEELINESRISKIITESLTKKVIILILGLLIIFPFLSDDFYTNNNSISYSMLAEYLATDEILYANYSYIIPREQLYLFFDSKFPTINITIGSRSYYVNPDYEDVNYFRYKEISTQYSEDGTVCVVYSLLEETKLEGILNMVQTLFVCLCLSLATILFENDANTLVLTPLEIMTEIVETVAKDPMNAKNVEDLQTGIKAAINEEENKTEQTNNDNSSKKNINTTDNENYEVSVIKTAIIKISALLAIGFGEAGGHIITQNLENDQELLPKFKGKKKTAIFGFCDIREFDTINIALEERISLLVNGIAEIVHSSVDRFGGATNKNIGEAFLNVWKFYNETPIKTTGTNGLHPRKQIIQRKDNLMEIDPTNIQVSITADSSIMAFLRIIMKINKSYSLLSYRENPDILKHIPNFKLNMGFGLHVGYGIEGAIGSSYKIDASYLSPNVNIAARLETATRQFGVSLLISGPLYDKCSDDMKRICRYVDCVMVKGSEQPLDLYTVDVNLDLKPSDEKKVHYASIKEKRKKYAIKREQFRKEVEFTRNVPQAVLVKSSYMELLKTKRNEEFYSLWNDGVTCYKEGNFNKAGECFKKCLAIEPNDGPAKTLLKYFEKVKYMKPQGWKGVRELTSK